MVGRVAAEDLDWFEQRPLFGTRWWSRGRGRQAGGFSAQLGELGAEVIHAPVIAFAEADDGGAARRHAAAQLAAGAYEWLLVTSANGVERIFAELRDARSLAGVKIGAVGPGTAGRCVPGGWSRTSCPTSPPARTSLPRWGPGPGRVLLVRPEVARDVVARDLRAAGFEVDEVAAYRTVPVAPDDEVARSIATADVATFTSSSTVDHLISAVGIDGLPPVLASIGPITSATLRAHGLEPTVEAAPHTIAGLVEAVVGVAGRTTTV